MATTTNYSWLTPDDTALVKDGAAAIRSLGTAIDTTVFNNSSAGIAKTIVDAKGDIIAATAADTVSRLAVGANDTVLIADSSTATGLKWGAPAAGGMTLISNTTLSGTLVTLSSIPNTYNNLFLVLRNVNLLSADGLFLRFNTDSTSNRYQKLPLTGGTSDPFGENKIQFGDAPNATTFQNLFTISVPDYANTTTWKQCTFTSLVNDTSTATNYVASSGLGLYNQIGAISAISFFIGGAGAGTFQGGTVLLYGVK